MMKKLTALLLVLVMSLSVAFAWSCPSCGSDNGGKFCTECGAKKPEDVICPSCGTNYGDAAPKFCMECGTKLGEAAPASIATPAPEEQTGPDVMLYPIDGSLSLIWLADGETEYRIHVFPKWHDRIEDDMTAENLSYGLEFKDSLGVYTINHMPAGQAFWVGVFDAQGNGEYVPYTPDLPVPAFEDCQAELFVQQMIRREGADDAQVDSFTLADVATGSGVTPGLYMACFYENPGEAIDAFVQVVVETPAGDKYVSSVNTVTVKAAAEDAFGWSFYSLAGHFMLMESIYGEIPVGDYPISMYLNGKHVGTASFSVTADVAAAVAPAATSAPADKALKITEVQNQLDGTYLLTWEDNGNGPWRVNFVDHWSDDMRSDIDDERTADYWLDAKELTETSHVLKYLVPGMSYWIAVTDSAGNTAQMIYDVPYAESDISAWLESRPRVRNGEEYVDLDAFSLANISNDNCGLYVKVHYEGIDSEMQKHTQMTLTLPNGVTFCPSHMDMMMFPSGSTYWEFWDMDWEFDCVEAWNDGMLLGEYRMDLYIEGKWAASATFLVSEDGTAASRKGSEEDQYGVEITGVRENADGTATVTWTDANNNGPYDVKYVQKFSDDFFADRDTGTGVWYDMLDVPLGSYDLRYLVPGQAYWICVYDADGYGQHTAYTPAAAQAFPEFTMKMDLTPLWRLGEDQDMTVSEFSSAEIAAKMAEHGLDLWIEYPQLARARDYLGVVAITSPVGDSTVDSRFNFHLDQGAASSVGWTFFDLEWYFSIMESNYGAVPVGTYTVTLYCDGEVACSSSFHVTD